MKKVILVIMSLIILCISGMIFISCNPDLGDNGWVLTAYPSPVEKGEIQINPEKNFYEDGEELTLTISSDSDYVFDAWYGENAEDLVKVSDSTYTLIMDSDKSFVAIFNKTQDVVFLEDFETGDFNKYDWVLGGNTEPEIITNVEQNNNGNYLVKFGSIDHSQVSNLEITIDVAEELSLSYWCKTSSESGYDGMKFYVDSSEMEFCTGEMDWSQMTYTLSPGQHDLKWEYYKDSIVSSGQDTAWIDNIKLGKAYPEINVMEGNTFIVSNASIYDFGEVQKGLFKEATFIIENWGLSELEITGDIDITGNGSSAYEIIENPTSNTIQPGGSVSLKVKCESNNNGVKDATLTIPNTDSDENPYNIALASNIVDPQPLIEVLYNNTLISNGAEIDLGAAQINNPKEYEFKIRNMGNATLNLTGNPKIRLNGDSEFVVKQTPADTSLEYGESTTFTIEFNTPNLDVIKNASIEIPNNDENITYNIKSVGVERAWTIMLYIDGDNNVEEYFFYDLNEMEMVELDYDLVKIIVVADRIGGYWTGDGDWTDTRAFELGYDPAGYNEELNMTDGPHPTQRIAIPPLGITETSTDVEVNMGDGETLRKFVEYSMSEFPAANYMLIPFNHGGGWRNDDYKPVPFLELCWDETSGGDVLYMKEVRQALETAINNAGEGKIDVLPFEACLMGMLEVYYEMKSVAEISIASAEVMYALGFPFKQIFDEIQGNEGNIDPVDMSNIIVDQYYDVFTNGGHINDPSFTTTGVTISAVDLSDAKMSTLASSIDTLANSLDPSDSAVSSAVNSCTYYSQLSWSGDLGFRELWDFCDKIKTTYPQAQSVMDAVDDAVINVKTGTMFPNHHGMAIYLPKNTFDQDYNSNNIEFANDAPNWATFIDDYTN